MKDTKQIRFEIKVDACFYAKNIDDAFLKLSKYFKGLFQEGVDYDGVQLESGQVIIKPSSKQ